ncbi:YbaK/prolyl-tRNA synthetase associated domain-containing protein [Budviciaceae bacterium BWR-B9]|uniref:YbaK/prolyl-tRNA synthetase associated domain-containing protein n=1 Tax=Limnobaculum allomyrinae TaxID=2791986 RepID=A0ABS1IR68_9GAMM|nr:MULTISPECIES: YbaK/EbsC family protein [Limnobaculum]MBK5144197.1 YbaK/prolyl-tRNA synthetase associated domain-containing protein [Limnobaculum allomyrinae]MBV7692059.1 YbaK/prolyl-tRNA synthetase associated domain-containing protein [Limnobaculum sp. M2-1]
MVSSVIFNQLITLLEGGQARYRVIEHASAGRSEEAAKARGTQIEQGAKALVCHVKGNGIKQHVLAVLPAHRKANLQVLAQKLGGTRASLASPQEVMALTQCVFGAIPPFSFHPDLKLVVDPLLFNQLDEMVFNAGSLEKSLLLNVEDYQRIVKPEQVEFSESA